MTAQLVVHVALQLQTGGMERLLLGFAGHADRRRFALHFVCLGERGPVAAELESLGWPVTAMNAGPGVRPGLALQLSKLFRELDADVVHTHNTKPLLYAGPAARLAGVPAVIHTRHGQRHGASKRQDAMFRLAARCADRVVCVSADAERRCEGDGVRAGSVVVIHNGIDGGRFAAARWAAGGPAVYVGRLSPEKDVGTLLRAAALVVKRVPRFRLRIAGTGPCEAELRGLSRSSGLESCVEFLGEVRDVPALLDGASLFVLPSITEGLPLTVLEAMAAGLPVVATAVGGTPEVVVDGETGLLVPAFADERLAEAIVRSLLDAQRAAAMGRAGRRRVADLFEVRTMVSRYESMYHGVLAQRERLAA